MGWRLMGDVFDHYHGSHVSKMWLLAFAHSANDRTRQGWPGRKLMAARVDVSPVRVSNIAAELVAEGVIIRCGGGHRGQAAMYELLPLGAAAGSPGTHSDSQPKGSPRPNPMAGGKGSARANPKPQIKGSEPERKGSDSTGKGSVSSPLPAETPKPQVSKATVIEATVKGAPRDIAGITPPTTAQTLVAEYVNQCRKQPPRQVLGQLGKYIAVMLAEGIDADDIRRGVAKWAAKSLSPSVLPAIVNEVMNNMNEGSHRSGFRQVTYTDEEYARGWS